MENTYFYELYGKEKVEYGREKGRVEIIQNLLERGLSVEQFLN